MPFTFSHPAAVVPLTRYGLVFSAMVVGSMSPDFEMFLYLPSNIWQSHTFSGIFKFSLPIGLAVLWIFHRVLKFPLLSLLPISHQQRLLPIAREFRFFPVQRFILILLSLLAGAFTHITWDALTHGSGWIVKYIPFLSQSVALTSHYSIRIYKILQHGSTIAGAGLLIYWYISWFRLAPQEPLNLPEQKLTEKAKIIFIILMVTGTSLLAGIYGIFSTSEFSGISRFSMFIRNSVISGISIMFITLLIFSRYWYIFTGKTKP